ncbi:MAG: hypothetical protein H0X33_14515 [Taibaiella sp.]|nr:hypothetical protein [Taibaiella sp.]
MDASQKKIDKRFVLSDSGVNCYGFRLLTNGYQLGEFQKNPIGYFMHNRDEGVMLRWDDIKIEGDTITGTPIINLNNPRGTQTATEIESGFLNAASVGHIVVLEYSTDPKDMLPNQKGPTVTKWYNRECSIVDIPGNYNSLCKLFDADDKEINLADFNNQIKNLLTMENTVSPEMIQELNLAAGATPDVAMQAIKDLKAKAARVDDLETQVTDLKAGATASAVKTILDGAQSEGRVTVPVRKELEKQYADKPEDLKALVATFPKASYPLDKVTVAADKQGKQYQALADKTYDELMSSGEMATVKEKYPELYAEKFESKFDKKPE